MFLLGIAITNGERPPEFLHESYQYPDETGFPDEDVGETPSTPPEKNMFAGKVLFDELEPIENDLSEKDARIEVHYQNNWDGDLHVECTSGYGIYKFQSVHDNGKEDRLWRFDCKQVRMLALL